MSSNSTSRFEGSKACGRAFPVVIFVTSLLAVAARWLGLEAWPIAFLIPLTVIFKPAQATEKSWNRLRGHGQLPKVIIGVKFNDGIKVVRSQAQTAAA